MSLNQKGCITNTWDRQAKVFTLNHSSAMNNWKRLQIRGAWRMDGIRQVEGMDRHHNQYQHLFKKKNTTQVVFQNKQKRDQIF